MLLLYPNKYIKLLHKIDRSKERYIFSHLSKEEQKAISYLVEQGYLNKYAECEADNRTTKYLYCCITPAGQNHLEEHGRLARRWFIPMILSVVSLFISGIAILVGILL